MNNGKSNSNISYTLTKKEWDRMINEAKRNIKQYRSPKSLWGKVKKALAYIRNLMAAFIMLIVNAFKKLFGIADGKTLTDKVKVKDYIDKVKPLSDEEKQHIRDKLSKMSEDDLSKLKKNIDGYKSIISSFMTVMDRYNLPTKKFSDIVRKLDFYYSNINERLK